ncbi:SLC13 family permease [Streptomyces nanshensis]|uniref:Dicarboxylate carrier MatC N-terminal domain-containing protein n=1 Tax=Streptomyces nanshensis TaxID=518642 RepID=A0A1E7L0V8_9ACTN|nr:SLC13 family permease [Streptomyces nanshensis]OEV09814.1 hypothetical protein AN218_20395 [Streptomyces nanshensis]
MSDQVISIVGLVLVFAIATFSSVHMGALAIVAAFVVGTAFVGESADDIFGGFPGDLFVVLVGVTFLFAIAKNNGTVDWMVQRATRAVGGRIALIPWVMFLVTAVLTASGAVVPAAVGIIAPIGLGFCVRYRINPVLMGLLIINGASAGGFSPISIFGSITNGVVSRNDLPGSPLLLFLCSFLFNVVLSIAVFFLFGGRGLLGRRAEQEGGESPVSGRDGDDGDLVTVGASAKGGDSLGGDSGSGTGTESGSGGTAPSAGKGTAPAPVLAPVGSGTGGGVAEPDEDLRLDGTRVLTLLGLVSLVVGSLFFDLDVGLMALTVSVVLTLVSPSTAKGAVDRCAWSTVLLVCGIVTFVSMMERIGTIDFLGDSVAAINAPLLGAVLICLIGAVVSAFASTTGILGALIPLAVPFLQDGHVGAVGLIIALAISSSVVDSSPFSTSGALVVASAPEEQRDTVFRRLMVWGFSMVAIAPPLTWLFFVVPGWL